MPCDRCRGTGKIVETPCHTCNGDGRVERKRKLRVTVPAGIDDSHQIRLSGEGEAAPRGGVPGNLYVVVHVTPHPQLRRRDTELYYDLPLSITQAALGARVTVPTADGDEEIEIKPGTQTGQEIRLRGKGVPHLRRQDFARRPARDGRGARPVAAHRRASASCSRSWPWSSGEVEPDGEAGHADGASAADGVNRRTRSGRRRRKRGLSDRLRDAIS